VIHSLMTAQLDGGDAGFGLADQIKGQEANRQRQLLLLSEKAAPTQKSVGQVA
jgi:hypothetical protein